MKRQPVYDSREVCLSCGAQPTNRKTGLCRHCDEGGDEAVSLTRTSEDAP